MNSPKKTAEFLKHYLIRFEVENIKTIIKAVNAELHLEQKQAKIYFAPENYFNNLAIIEEALRASSINQVVSTLTFLGSRTLAEYFFQKTLTSNQKNR